MDPLRAALGLLLVAAIADERTAVPPCSRDKEVPRPPGQVVRLFELHKNRNPENVLVIYTYADEACRLIGSGEHKERLVDMYWRMKARSPDECYKPTHPKIKSETLEALAVKSLSADRRTFVIDITPLDELDHDLPTREAQVTLRQAASGCEATVEIPLEPGSVLRVQEIHARADAALALPRRSLDELELVGRDADGRPIRRVYHSR
jgi:hypothetical protein